MFTHILTATDGSEGAKHAVSAAAELARRYGAKLTVINVFEPPVPPMPPVGAAIPMGLDAASFGAWNDAAREWAAAMKESVEANVRDAVGPEPLDYVFRQETGHPADTILRAAESGKADLVVVGSRGLSGIKSFLLGSVSDRVVHHSHCPVLVTK